MSDGRKNESGIAQRGTVSKIAHPILPFIVGPHPLVPKRPGESMHSGNRSRIKDETRIM